MIGTTRSRVSFFMNRFRKLGFLNYRESGIQVHSSLLNELISLICKVSNVEGTTGGKDLRQLF
jgi:CRP/FNR family transcriptional regulator, cyclic AMP receptor protein